MKTLYTIFLFFKKKEAYLPKRTTKYLLLPE